MKLIKYSLGVLFVAVFINVITVLAYSTYNEPATGIVPVYFELSGTNEQRTDYYIKTNLSDYLQSYSFDQNITTFHPNGCSDCTIRATLYKKQSNGTYSQLHVIIGHTGEDWYFDNAVSVNSHDPGTYQVGIRRNTFVVGTTFTFGDWYINHSNPSAGFQTI